MPLNNLVCGVVDVERKWANDVNELVTTFFFKISSSSFPPPKKISILTASRVKCHFIWIAISRSTWGEIEWNFSRSQWKRSRTTITPFPASSSACYLITIYVSLKNGMEAEVGGASADKEIKVQQQEKLEWFFICATVPGRRRLIYSRAKFPCAGSTHRGRRWEIIRSASSGVGGENFSSGGTSGCVERAGCATSSVGWKSGTNFALERDWEVEFMNKSINTFNK